MPNLGISFPVAYNAYQIFNTCMWIDNTTKVVLNFFYNPKVEKQEENKYVEHKIVCGV